MKETYTKEEMIKASIEAIDEYESETLNKLKFMPLKTFVETSRTREQINNLWFLKTLAFKIIRAYIGGKKGILNEISEEIHISLNHDRGNSVLVLDQIEIIRSILKREVGDDIIADNRVAISLFIIIIRAQIENSYIRQLKSNIHNQSAEAVEKEANSLKALISEKQIIYDANHTFANQIELQGLKQERAIYADYLKSLENNKYQHNMGDNNKNKAGQTSGQIASEAANENKKEQDEKASPSKKINISNNAIAYCVTAIICCIIIAFAYMRANRYEADKAYTIDKYRQEVIRNDFK